MKGSGTLSLFCGDPCVPDVPGFAVGAAEAVTTGLFTRWICEEYTCTLTLRLHRVSI